MFSPRCVLSLSLFTYIMLSRLSILILLCRYSLFLPFLLVQFVTDVHFHFQCFVFCLSPKNMFQLIYVFLSILSSVLCETVLFVCVPISPREGVGTSNFTTTTGHFFLYIESVFLVHHYYKIRTSKMAFQLIRTSKIISSLLRQKFRLSML